MLEASCAVFCTVSVHQEELKENQEASETLTELISAQNDACVQHKAASDRKDFMTLAGCLASHKVWVGVGQITVCVNSVLCANLHRHIDGDASVFM